MSDTTAFPHSVPATTASRVQAAHLDQETHGTHPFISFTKRISAQSFTDMREAAGLSQDMCSSLFAKRSSYFPHCRQLLKICEAIGVHPAHLIPFSDEGPAPKPILEACLMILEGRYEGPDRYIAESFLDREMIKSQAFVNGNTEDAQILRGVDEAYHVHRNAAVTELRKLEDGTLRALFQRVGVKLLPTALSDLFALPRSESLRSAFTQEINTETETDFESRAMIVLAAEKDLIARKPALIRELEANIRRNGQKAEALRKALYTPDQLENPENFRSAFRKMQAKC